MTAVILVGLMVGMALVLAITWVEPRVLGGPPAPHEGTHDAVRPLEPVEEPRAVPSGRRAA